MGIRCYVCNKKCVGYVTRGEGNKYIHSHCLKCSKCSTSLVDIGYFLNETGELLCENDYRKLPRAVVTDILVKEVQLQDQQLPSPIQPNVCFGCKKELSNGQILSALNNQWHIWCFKCSECETVLSGEYITYNNKPLCIRDYNNKYGVKCHECDKYIASNVLQAGDYKFHPTCAKCTRCGENFGNGEEMFMQGDEIWHPRCQNLMQRADKKGSQYGSISKPKYQSDFGQHLTYMYLLPEAEQTYLKQPIPPHPLQPTQFHTPQGPIKIRKSRLSMLKTGMQRLTEDLERSLPRAKSPSMDNEEPIELAHYPAGHAPEPGIVPAIEREDFPAPPFPYAVEELKRRLSTSSVDDLDEEDFEESDDKHGEDKLQKAFEQLECYDKDSSIAHVIMQNLQEAHKKQKLPLYYDPRNASRTPSAKKMSHLRFRYNTPVNASPSRHLNRPKPWIRWKDGEKAATTVIPSFHVPNARMDLYNRAATLPDGYHYGKNVSLDGYTTISSHFSDQSLDAEKIRAAAYISDSIRDGATMAPVLRSSLPDMSRPAKTYSLSELVTSNKKLPEDADRAHLERHLSRIEFETTFNMSPLEFYKLPEWKRINLKRRAKLF